MVSSSRASKSRRTRQSSNANTRASPLSDPASPASLSKSVSSPSPSATFSSQSSSAGRRLRRRTEETVDGSVDRTDEEELNPIVTETRVKSSVTAKLLTSTAATASHSTPDSDSASQGESGASTATNTENESRRRSTRARKAPEKFADSADEEQLRLIELLSSADAMSDDEEGSAPGESDSSGDADEDGEAAEEEYAPAKRSKSRASGKAKESSVRRDKGKSPELPPSMRRRRTSATARLAVANSTPLRVPGAQLNTSEDATEVDEPTASGASSSSSKVRGGSKKSKASNGQKKSSTQSTLFDILSSGKRTGTLSLIKEWMCTYRRSHTAGLAELINLVLESCGLPAGSVAAEDIDEVDITQLLADLGDESVSSVGVDYPVLKRTRFRISLLDFFDKLVSHCKEDVLFDEYLIESLVEWLISLSSCNARHFRHTATLISLQLVSSHISVAADLSTKLEISHTQVEQLQTTKNKNSDVKKKLVNLRKTVDLQHARVMQLEAKMTEVFKGVFSHRYRDVVPEVRTACIQSLGEWIRAYPSVFLADSYLKYIGWLLNDKVATVRQAALGALITIFETPDFVGQLTHFTERFRSRFVECTLDVDPSVAVAAIQLCVLLSRCDLLANEAAEEHVSTLYHAVCAADADIRSAAGRFVIEHYFSQFSDQSEESIASTSTSSSKARAGKKGKKHFTQLHVQLRALLNFVLTHSLHPKVPEYTVDSLWGGDLAVLTNWEAMVAGLGALGEDMTPQEQYLLAQVCRGAVQKGCGLEICPKSARETDRTPSKDEIETNRTAMTLCFAAAMPLLIERYGADGDILECLLDICAQFHFEAAAQHELAPAVVRLLKKATSSLFSLSHAGMMRSLSKLYATICALPTGILSDVEPLFASLGEQLHDDLRAKLADLELARKEFDEEHRDDPDETESAAASADSGELRESAQAAVAALDRVRSFFLDHDLTALDIQFELNEMLSVLARDIRAYGSLTDCLAGACIAVRALYFMWHRIWADNAERQPTELAALGAKVNEFVGQLTALLDCSVSRPRCNEHAYTAICDLVTVYPQTRLRGTALQVIGVQTSELLQARLIDYVHARRTQQTESMEHDDDTMEDVASKYRYTMDLRSVVLLLARAVSSGAFPEEMSVNLLMLFTRCGSEVDQVLRNFHRLLRQRLGDTEWRVILRAMVKQFEVAQDTDDSAEMECFVSLSKRFSRSFVQMAKVRQQMIWLVLQGIEYGCSEQGRNIAFLDGLSKFTSRLYPQDIAAHIVDALKEHASKLPEDATPGNADFVPLYSFEAALEKRTKVPIDLASVPKGVAAPPVQHLQFDAALSGEQARNAEESLSGAEDDEDHTDTEDDALETELHPKKKSKPLAATDDADQAEQHVEHSSIPSSSTSTRRTRRRR